MAGLECTSGEDIVNVPRSTVFCCDIISRNVTD